MRATFLLSKDPSTQSTGDMTMATLVMKLAAESYDVGAICLSPQASAPAEDGLRRVHKPQPRPSSLLQQSARWRTSLVHTRFAFAELIEAVDDTDTDIFVAMHTYMGEAVVRSRRHGEHAAPPLAVSTEVPEALVWRETRGLIGRTEARRIVRDELRVTRQAYSVGCYDTEETRFYQHHELPRVHWLNLTLPAAQQVPVAASAPRLVLLGDRRWPPNQQAFEQLARLWPEISRGIAAEAYVVGAPEPSARPLALPEGMHDVGFVDDLDGFLATCRALVAPIRTGGGVRVKILDAAARGMPVVGTRAAVGSLVDTLGISACADDEQLVARCREYLLDPARAAADGAALHERNTGRWRAGEPHTCVQDWLAR